ncbi:MAG: 4'-phosphopantetheinyl transferase superfamily protein [Steroidobacter sp.]
MPPRHHIDIWLCYETDVGDDLLHAYAPLLTDAERARAARFHFAADRNRHVISRALLRTVLPSYLRIPHQHLVFRSDRFGRPSLNNAEALGLDFNLSHTRGLIALAVTSHSVVGVDVENASHQQPAMELASRFFSPDEVASLRTFDGSALNLEFYRHWTLKESYLKAYGVGLSLPLDRFGFRLAEHRAEFYLAPDAEHRADEWYFAQWRASPDHLLAVCSQHGHEKPPAFKLRRIIPLNLCEDIELPQLCSSTSRSREFMD